MLIFGLKFHKFLIDQLCWCAQGTDTPLSSTPRILGSTSSGSEFQAEVKKNHITCLHAKAHGNRSRLTLALSHTGYGVPV